MALRGTGEYKEAIEVLNEAIKIRELSLSRDPQNARSRALLAGNIAERGSTFLQADKLTEALRDFNKAVELQTSIIEVDPRGTSARTAMADFQNRLASAYAALAVRTPSKAQQNWREAAKYYRRADALYTALEGDGLLRSPQLKAGAKRAHDGAVDAAAQLGEPLNQD